MGNLDDFKLLVEAGLSSELEFALTDEETVIGRDSSQDSDIIISSPAVSRRHARIFRTGNTYYLQDLGSSNGTFLNGQRLDDNPRSLKTGDRVGLGRSIVLVFEGPESAPFQQPDERASHGKVGADGAIAETVLAEEFGLKESPSLPQLTVALAGGDTRAYELTKETLTLGRAEDNDITISSKIVSRHQARLERVEEGYQLVVLPDASNAVYCEGRPISAPRVLKHGDVLRIGSLDPGLMVTMTYANVAQAGELEFTETIHFGEKSIIQIGRDPSNDVRLDAPTVSRFHAQIERVGKRYRVRDLNSSNGTFVNQERISDQVWIEAKDSVQIGPYRYVMGEDELAQYDESGGIKVEAIDLNKWVRDDLNILQNISVIFQPREFIVVVGQSGGGKSTLLDAISGYRPATHGHVLCNDVDAYRHFDLIRNNIGYVPQKDIIHMELTVYQALDYAAQLRMPPDTTPEERHERVMEVLEDLDLTHRKDVQISGLSGGQQKRVSIGVELLTKPGLFFLDEPTSGLDPGTETALMQLMRHLADQGRTIVLITHATKNVMLADKVLFLARGGYLVWFGPPDEALKYFDGYRSERQRRAGKMEFDDIYAILEDTSKGAPEEWAKRFQEDPAYEKYVSRPLEGKRSSLQSGPQTETKPAPVGQSHRRVSNLRQFLILSSRNLKILTRDRFSLVLMLISAPLIGMLDVLLSVLLGRDSFDYFSGNIADVSTTLFMLTIYGVMIGGISQMREIVKEGDIYKRERMVNLRIVPYVLSKIWVAALLALYQAACYVLIHYLAFDMPGGALEFGLIYVTLTLATMAGMMLGLFASALAPTANAAPLLVILLMLPQFVVGGALIPVPRFVSAPTATSWAFEALMGITGVGSDIASDPCWDLPKELRSGLSIEDKSSHCKCMGVNLLHQEACSFPGTGEFYNAAVDAPPPLEPPALRDPPPEPVLPEAPPEPQDQSDNVAVAAYLESLKDYQDQVEKIRSDYKAQVDQYQAEADIYTAEVADYQKERVQWEINRASAIEPAEASIDLAIEQFGWSFMNKADPEVFWFRLGKTWFAQSLIIAVLFTGILVLQKRKDVA
jgi:ABC-type multidrug transport system ATPase subunit/pSer/pThr/pTyr-binding forkhead associated (FHA) protein